MQTSRKKTTASPEKSRTVSKGRAALFLSILLLGAATGTLVAYTFQRLHTPAIPVSSAEAAMARAVYYTSNKTRQPFSDAPELSPLNGTAGNAEAASETTPAREIISEELNARSAILIDAASGSILFEKNADEQIPPASMTKLVAIYTAFHAAENGEISLDDVVALPPECWASNIPAGSSLMFLGPGQHVTVRELLLGMAVVSGNDAAIALADHVSGSVPAYVERMNREMEMLGLANTRFVEPSGLSEKNMTTAREFADFSLVYIRNFPEALRALHSKTELSYPEQWNLPEGHHERPIRQKATNQLLGDLPGCDGLKTGFINESGYNFSLTAERNGSRFISVTMGGSGANSREGNQLRAKDGSLLMEWAFSNFRTVRPAKIAPQTIPVWGGTIASLEVIPAGTEAFTVSAGLPSAADADATEISMHERRILHAPIHAGDVIGTVDYVLNGKVVHTVPLIADRSVAKARLPKRVIDSAASFIARIAL